MDDFRAHNDLFGADDEITYNRVLETGRPGGVTRLVTRSGHTGLDQLPRYVSGGVALAAALGGTLLLARRARRAATEPTMPAEPTPDTAPTPGTEVADTTPAANATHIAHGVHLSHRTGRHAPDEATRPALRAGGCAHRRCTGSGVRDDGRLTGLLAVFRLRKTELVGVGRPLDTATHGAEKGDTFSVDFGVKQEIFHAVDRLQHSDPIGERVVRALTRLRAVISGVGHSDGHASPFVCASWS
ncbi:hypothetical protein [Streptomyces buecherae]|uniref:hypothetical protein n=1 Tax=Streptomyces buecherae TaxID=2763006 RepID=UPI00368D2269